MLIGADYLREDKDYIFLKTKECRGREKHGRRKKEGRPHRNQTVTSAVSAEAYGQLYLCPQEWGLLHT